MTELTLRNTEISSDADRVAALEAEIVRLRKALDEVVRRAASGAASSTADHEREIA